MQASPQRLDHMRHHGGFSLVELLIVMAVLAAVAGLTLPAMRGPLDKSRLTGAAKQLQAALAKARSLAIREGTAVNFRYEIFGDRYVIERGSMPINSAVTVLEDATGLSSTPSGLSIETGASTQSTAESLLDEGLVTVLREGILPAGVIFAVPPDAEPGLSLSQSSATVASASTVPAEQTPSATIRRWSEPVRFLPGGRTKDQVIRITGQRDFVVEVFLRGLTASASYSAPSRTAAELSKLAAPAPAGGLP
jgi:prepilin-type N-terminal cleavage/methylation domain-containing protein